MTRQQVLDLYFIEARAKLLDIAAFLDRADRAKGPPDFRLAAFNQALGHLKSRGKNRARNILLELSDHSRAPIKAAGQKGAAGAPLSK